jgi:hypothetical protein
MTNERVEQIEQAIAAVEAQGQRWSNASIYAQVGGRYADLSQYLKQRRAHRRAETAVAVAEEDEPRELEPVEEAEPEPDRPPLIRARRDRDQAREREWQLGVSEQALKVRRHQLEEAIRVEEYNVARQHSDVLDLASRRRLGTLRQEWQEVETERLTVHQQRRALHGQVLAANDQYAALHGQAARWLRRLREARVAGKMM